MATRILIVDDESAVRKVIRTTMQALGYEVFDAARGEDAIAFLVETPCDVVLLDVNMPGIGGVTACRSIHRMFPEIPILMLTVRDSEDQKIEAFDAGADDYITKPFAIRELTARINAVLRRTQKNAAPDTRIIVNDIAICTEQRTLIKRDQPIHLTRTQFAIVEVLMLAGGRTVPHRKLLTTVWGAEYRYHVEYLRTYMRQLRMLLEDDPANPQYLVTVPYLGYRFCKSDMATSEDG